MKQNWMYAGLVTGALIAGCTVFNPTVVGQSAKPKIVHDSEYYILETQHSEQWATQDQEMNQKLAELRQKYGTPPNIIHIMWDDTAVGEVGIPAIQKVRGFETPNINRLASEGINFMRMYTEPSCTPSRAAALPAASPCAMACSTWAFPTSTAGWPPPRSRPRRCCQKPATRRPSSASAYRRHRSKLHDQPRLR